MFYKQEIQAGEAVHPLVWETVKLVMRDGQGNHDLTKIAVIKQVRVICVAAQLDPKYCSLFHLKKLVEWWADVHHFTFASYPTY
jgi:hypothetical protein